jgi:hypothetical protein
MGFLSCVCWLSVPSRPSVCACVRVAVASAMDWDSFLTEAAQQVGMKERAVTVVQERAVNERVVAATPKRVVRPRIVAERVVTIQQGKRTGSGQAQPGRAIKVQTLNQPSRGISKKVTVHKPTSSRVQLLHSSGRRAAGTQHDGVRQNRRFPNPHQVGYTCRFGEESPPPLDQYTALANGDPSIMRCVWRGLFKVRGLEGSACVDGLLSRALRNALHRYTRAGDTSSHARINNALARSQGADLPDDDVRELVIELVSAVRLLWTPQGASKVYRGLRCDDVALYEQAKLEGKPVQWDSFTSTSRDRQVALSFAGSPVAPAPRLLFVIKRDPSHCAAADISKYSAFPDEQEVLLLPAMRFEVEQIRRHGDGLVEVVLRELVTFPLAV